MRIPTIIRPLSLNLYPPVGLEDRDPLITTTMAKVCVFLFMPRVSGPDEKSAGEDFDEDLTLDNIDFGVYVCNSTNDK